MAEGTLQQEAEKWCTEDCTGNRFWKMTETMWFCTRCQVWYHYGCCQATVNEKQHTQLEEYLQIPLLKGGAFGKIGTAPLVFSAAKTMQKIQGGGTIHNWKELLDEDLGQSAESFLKEVRESQAGLLDSYVKCPKCDPKSE
jgi:hypothetical protein